jgi:hypothetical protein
MSPSEALAGAIKLLGGATEVAKMRGLKTAWGVSKWEKDGLPAAHVLWLAEQTAWRFTPHQLAPDLYPHPDDGLPERFRGGRLSRLDAIATSVGQAVA